MTTDITKNRPADAINAGQEFSHKASSGPENLPVTLQNNLPEGIFAKYTLPVGIPDYETAPAEIKQAIMDRAGQLNPRNPDSYLSIGNDRTATQLAETIYAGATRTNPITALKKSIAELLNLKKQMPEFKINADNGTIVLNEKERTLTQRFGDVAYFLTHWGKSREKVITDPVEVARKSMEILPQLIAKLDEKRGSWQAMVDTLTQETKPQINGAVDACKADSQNIKIDLAALMLTLEKIDQEIVPELRDRWQDASDQGLDLDEQQVINDLFFIGQSRRILLTRMNDVMAELIENEQMRAGYEMLDLNLTNTRTKLMTLQQFSKDRWMRQAAHAMQAGNTLELNRELQAVDALNEGVGDASLAITTAAGRYMTDKTFGRGVYDADRVRERGLMQVTQAMDAIEHVLTSQKELEVTFDGLGKSYAAIKDRRRESAERIKRFLTTGEVSASSNTKSESSVKLLEQQPSDRFGLNDVTGRVAEKVAVPAMNHP